MKRKLISWILTFALAVVLFAAPVMAAEIDEEQNETDEVALTEEEVKVSDDAAPEDGDSLEEEEEEQAETVEDEDETIVTTAETSPDDEDDFEPVQNEIVDFTLDLYDVVEEENVNATLAVTNGFGQGDDGDWYYYVGGQIAVDTNSVIQGTVNDVNAWWYVVAGKVQLGFTGLADYSNSNGWWYIEDGKVTFNFNGVEKNKNGWYYIKDSKVDFSYNGFATNSNGNWYIENGKVTFNKNSVIKDTTGAIGTKGTWWYVVGSKVQTGFTGLADYSNENGWWYIENGKVTFTKDTIAKNKNGWYYVKDSKVDFNFTGLADFPNENGWWYCENGKVTFKKDTIAKNKNGWYYVKDSKVDFSFTGLADFPNENGWWYIENGKVTFTKETVAKNKNGWYYVKDSKVDFNYNGIAQNSNGWWYIKSGKVDFSAGDYSFAANTSQIIDVRASGNTGTLTLYNKNGGSFTQALSTSCYVGRNGITSNKSEGDGKTPSGVYTLGQAFGVASDPGSTRSYLKVTSNYYWVDDSTSKYYNQLVDISKVTKDWSSAEHLIDYTSAYKYAIAIDYNTACTPYKGSAIFLHCSTGSSTSGCVAVSESNMIKILQSLKSDTRIYIH